MICNIIDHRRRPYRWASVKAIVEATSHDNSVADTDIAPETPDDVDYAEEDGISLADAITWANNMPGSVTLYIYDVGSL